MHNQLSPIVALALLSIGAPGAASAQSTLARVGGSGGEGFGWTLTGVGDQNGDGIDEVCVGAPVHQAVAGGIALGRIRVYDGGSLLAGSPVLLHDILGPTVMAGCAGTSGSNFGGSVDGGQDINGDGTPDFVASASYSGAVIPFDGATGAPMLPGGFDIDGPCARRHGAQVRMLDADGDAYADLLVTQAAPSTTFRSRFVVYRGEWLRSPGSGVQKVLYDRRSTQLLDLMGAEAAILGDLDGDQLDDFALTAPFGNTGAFAGGSVVVISGGTGDVIHRFGMIAGEGGFGGSVVRVEDLDGDGLNELGVTQSAWPSAANALGRIEVVSGRWLASGGFGQRTIAFFARPGAAHLTQFGNGLVSTDLNGDGVDDLVASYLGADFVEWIAFSGRTSQPMWTRATSQPATVLFPASGAVVDLGSTQALLLGLPATPDGLEPNGGELIVARAHDGAGVRSTFGVGCPCGNDDASAGCGNLTGEGANLAIEAGGLELGSGSLTLTATGLPPFSFGLLMGGVQASPTAVGNGLLGVGQVIRLRAYQATGPGVMTMEGDLMGDFEAASALFPSSMPPTAGVPFAMQVWYRDTGCGGAANFTNVYTVVPRI